MKQVHGNSLILGTAAFVFLAAQPVWAQIAQVTDVQLKQANGGVSVVLKTSSGSRPQVFTTKRGKALVADVINTQLRLQQGNSFRQDNPAPGIASVEVNQLDANSVRVTVTGSNNVPGNEPVVRSPNGITLSFNSSAGTTASTPTPTIPTSTATAPPASTPAQTGQNPGVLVPNPQVTIDGQPAQPAGPGQPLSQAPPFLPRAVAPPVGDIAISATDASPSTIDLGTQERVPRLVLRDAPVREVLSLLARAAGLNLAYVGSEQGGGGQQGAAAQAASQTISLDIENEPVQDVFNYVLRLSGLEANRSNRTVFVGPKLPNATRDMVMRSLRLNQVTVDVALNFLVGLGAESAVSRERQVTSVSAVPVGSGVAPITQTQTTTETKIERLTLEDSKYTTPLLRGLQALGDQRTNSLTLIGPPRLVEMAMAQLTQLDIRRRQVVVNVKIIDVNLLNTQDYNTSFSFGVGNNYFTNDGGAASLNFGGSRPATSAEVSSSVTSTPVIQNPVTGTPFLDPNSSVSIPGTTPGTVVVDANGNITRVANPGSGNFYQPVAPSNTNPLQPGFTNITPATDNIIKINADGTSTVTQGTLGTATTALPSLFQFPKRLLASLQAQVQNGNAKILTDPTLIVQEGQTANVNLTQEVVGNIKREIVRDSNLATETISAEKDRVGLTLAVKVERIDDNGFVSLSVAPVVKAPQAPATINVGGGGSQQIFLVSERSLNSGLIRLRDGQTLILSGIIQDSDRTSVSKIPILGDLPLIGSLFRSTNRSNQRNEVIVLLTPQIMDDSENSSYGYNYSPSPQVRQMLERRGLKLPTGQ
ncbi:general secretion pathway protein GspD [Nostoc linckia z18]|uniref:General secretion pathway protein GspD n=2 Tax=Nostoc linckia TaxID=92942 RepID=A0A9Q5ZDW8_NOSLI|nr:type IV pilus secretin family protein [Nostoc linckia]PHK39664.1 general secretion pathway protein GspD [Nostoc linckia z15]PHK45525.1 general secretion pathway protein GspD [Nostoc linckia z16]PHJ66061.1 general secretion pathway protein GspD [Nostoc linckia z1]PHJ68968.1 general secretion pathway protein GspD [Nostoc linckia z3]PHJ74619.1 general secretion pathway protein GspD [Nostoc linckia z2]